MGKSYEVLTKAFWLSDFLFWVQSCFSDELDNDKHHRNLGVSYAFREAYKENYFCSFSCRPFCFDEILSEYRADKLHVRVNSRGHHVVEQMIDLCFLLHQLTSSLFHHRFQVPCVFLHLH